MRSFIAMLAVVLMAAAVEAADTSCVNGVCSKTKAVVVTSSKTAVKTAVRPLRWFRGR